MLKAQPLTTYARQHLLLKSGFVAKHPHAWIVWLATEAQDDASGAADTWVPGQSAPVAVGDPLCFELAGAQRFRLGSGNDCEVKLVAPGVAPEHCVLTQEGGSWHVAAGESVPSVMVSGNPVSAGIAVALTSGDHLVVGGVRLSFFTAEGFAARAAQAAAKL